ncbi:hypothetical protein WJ542_21125 [Paraburkholderia sp. B3]|uniref:hypothetical protein n=1 Tax=Paraburkholderia sp. B3 TaxID=3134791 RepID=UPI003982D44A
MKPQKPQDTHANMVDAMCAYMTDCRFDQSHLNSMCLSLAMEYVYQPRPRFWQDFNIAYITVALSRCIPDWRHALESTNGVPDRLLRDVGEFLHVKAFDEANAEMMLALPAHERPTDSASAFAWISSQLAHKGLKAELDFARRDGNACGEHALDALRCLEEAAAGRTIARTGALVARTYRDAVMKRHAESATQ